MISAIALVLFAAWVLGVATSSAMGGFLHLLLVVAVVMLFVRLFQFPRLAPRKNP